MSEIGRKRHVREAPCVPFLWEVRPGIAKKDWKPELCSCSTQFLSPKPPLKLIASVPFLWEEKPGTPLPNFSHNCSSLDNTVSSDESSETVTGMELETFSFDTDESISSSSVTIPMEEKSLVEVETPLWASFSETESCTSSYATGRSSPTGSTFLECLFPLYPPKSGFLERDENFLFSTQPAEDVVDDGECTNGSEMMMRKPPTLGELIMMSRRRSCRRKALQMKKWDHHPPKEDFGCFNFVRGNIVEGLLKKNYLPRMKLV
ncbi:hypothetical protein PIB30_046882 [Stylosanthes scabra]|uniref:Uncharacterized protein n=1 Tax=Stylosanthes scabra TaxID=79078 RepID=A0ABU6SGF8_9FABA|nr:hypothetical protein [Stylosanthes scabra]